MSSSPASKSILRTATVTISEREAASASRIVSKVSYFPVPVSSREPNSRPAMTSGSDVPRLIRVPSLA
jgi:hypothetical protein